jgi:hypothetical protein
MIDEKRLEELGLDARRGEPSQLRIGMVGRIRAWVWVHGWAIAGLVPLLTLVGVVQSWGMSRTPAPFDDEGTYVAQAWAVQAQHHLAHYTYWYDHPPLGWVQIAGWTWLTGAFDRVDHAVVAGREAMVLAVLVSAGLLYVLARRLELSRAAAFAAVALFTLSPLALAQHRMVFLDNVAVPWLLAALVLAASPRRSLWASGGAGVCLGVAVLSKETFLLLIVAVVWQLWNHCDRKTRSFCVTAFGVGFTTVVVAYPLYALLKGELIPGAGHVSLFDAVRFQLFERASSGSLLTSGTSAHATLQGWLDLDHWLLLVGALAIIPALRSTRLRPYAAGLGIQLLLLLRGGYLPGPFVIGMLPFAALLVAAVVDDAWRGSSRSWLRGAWLDRARRPAVAVLAVAAVLVVAPSWLSRDRALASTDSASPTWQAERWIAEQVPRDERVIVDDTMWLDLVHAGFDTSSVVWFFKLDATNNLDPSVREQLPDGWREFRYIVSTPFLRRSLDELRGGLQPVHDALDHSQVVSRFGDGDGRIEIRQITASPAGS